MWNRKIYITLYVLGLMWICATGYALNIARVKTWTTEILTATDLNAEFDNIINHAITNTDVAAGAAIAASKLDLSVPGAIGGTTPNAGSFTTLTSTGTTTIGDANTDTLQVNANTIQFDGATTDDYDLIFGIPDVASSDKTVTFPNRTCSLIGDGANGDIGSYSFTAQTIISDVSTGTAPFTVSSTTKVTNLDADLLDTYNTSSSAAATVIYVSDASNHLPDDALKTNIQDYATSASASTTRDLGDVIICYGELQFTGDGSLSVTNLPFTSSTSYQVVMQNESSAYTSNDPGVVCDSGAQFTATTGEGADDYKWVAIGI